MLIFLQELEFRFGRINLILRSQLANIQQPIIITEMKLEHIGIFSTYVRNIVASISSASCHQHKHHHNHLPVVISVTYDQFPYSGRHLDAIVGLTCL